MGILDYLKNSSRVRKGDLIIAFVGDSVTWEPDGTLWVSSVHKNGKVGSQVALQNLGDRTRAWQGYVVEVDGASRSSHGGHWYRVSVVDEVPPEALRDT